MGPDAGRPAASRALDTLCAGRLVYGAGLLLAPASLLSAVARAPLDRVTLATARVLGVRQLAQAAALGRRPGRRALQVGAGVDALHATSMVGAAQLARRRSHRRLAARDARSAGLLTLIGIYASARWAGLAEP